MTTSTPKPLRIREGFAIKQIIPAVGWSAVYAGKGSDGKPMAFATPLAVWAMVDIWDDARGQRAGEPPDAVGVKGYGAPDPREGHDGDVEDSVNFLGYLHVSESIARFQHRAEDYVAKSQL